MILGYVLALMIGVLLGLIGGGGSILTLPVLVYLFGVPPVLATAYSLFIVGVSSAVGSIEYIRKDLVDFRTAALFGIPSVLAVFFTRKYLIPSLPDTLFAIGSFQLSKDLFLMLLFGIIMLGASYGLLIQREAPKKSAYADQKVKYLLILAEGSIVGIFTGLVGAGGGFLVIPALVLFTGMPMKKAVGTSLLIIAAKSLIGFSGELGQTRLDWVFLSAITSLAILGLFAGIWISKRISGEQLKPIFGFFVLAMGIGIILAELML